MIDGVKTEEIETIKPEIVEFNWQGVCPVCREQTSMEGHKELDFLISPCFYVYAKCGHRFLIGKGGV